MGSEMKKKLFLCGPAFCGKSQLIRDMLGRQLQAAGGFCTELTADADGSLLGCTLMPAAAAGGIQGFEKQLFLDLRVNPPAHDSEVFRESGVRLLEEAEWYPFTVLDEIGGMDLLIPQFCLALKHLLSLDLPVLGILKSEENAEQLRLLLGPGPRFRLLMEELHRMLRDDPDTEIVRIREDARTEAGDKVKAWVSEFAAIPGI